MGEKRSQINIRLSPEQKDRWDEYVDQDGRYNTLAGLVRAAVESEIQSEDDGQQAAPGLQNDIGEIQAAVDEIRTDVAWLREQQQEDVDISDLAQDIYDELEVLPEPKDVEVPADVDDSQEHLHHQAALLVIQPEGSDEPASPQTASDIAERVGTSPGRVHDAIDYLEEQFLPVVGVEIDGELHYFKEE